MYENLFISCAGMIGAGKSTLTKALSEELKMTPYYEPVEDNPYLEKFYQNMSKYAFPMQIWLLNKRYQQHQQISWNENGAIQDRSLYEDKVFANILTKSKLMEKTDYDTYCTLFDNMKNNIRLPNFIIYLHVTPKISMHRIKMRNRECEKTITMEYLNILYEAYEDFIKEISRIIPVFRVDYTDFKSGKQMANEVLEKWKTLSMVI